MRCGSKRGREGIAVEMQQYGDRKGIDLKCGSMRVREGKDLI